MKAALCFIINYDHILNKEEIWKEWIEPNKDIINVYFFYKDLRKIKSKWILEHTIPPNYIVETSYYHVIPAYLSIMNFAFKHDEQNKWFCMLTDSCCPIISPKRFRYLFYENYNYSLFSWKDAWWNIEIDKRANLAKLPKELRLANDPWFTLTRENVKQVFHFVSTQQTLTKTICDGGLANESLFAIIFKVYKELEDGDLARKSHINCTSTHITDWSRPTSSTSPHVFKDANEKDIKFIEKRLNSSVYYMFIRKIDVEFPDDILRKYIYSYNKEKHDKSILIEPYDFKMNRYMNYVKKCVYWFPIIIVSYFLYKFIL